MEFILENSQINTIQKSNCEDVTDMRMIKWTLDIVLAQDQQTHKKYQCDYIKSKNRIENTRRDTILLFALILIPLDSIYMYYKGLA